MTKHEFKLKKNAVKHAEDAREAGYRSYIVKHSKARYPYCVYVYRK